MAEQRLMRDGLGADAVDRMARTLCKIIDEFPFDRFVKDALNGLAELELKQRVHHLIDVLHKYLPSDFTEAAEVLHCVKENWDWGNKEDSFSVFAGWPLIDYVSVYGRGHSKISLELLKDLTPLSSAEFAIRPFLMQNAKQTEKVLLKWCRDKDEHVRRLVSEGIRPRLPWGIRLQQYCEDPLPVLKLLEQLKSDKSEYVRRSVANNLNDISKDHPDLVLKTCQAWLKEGNKDTEWIIRHGTRSLVKAGHQEVFQWLGFSVSPKLSLEVFRVGKNQIKMGDKLSLFVKLKSKSKKTQHLAVDYAIHHMKANGQLTAKVFKWKVFSLGMDDSIEISKAHLFKAITTRKYYKGKHRVELLINGKSYGIVDFTLSV
ncbi:MAG: DNA alkylation repair protein [Opitutaceae bacterium]|nr:DNA alkylation repair protein [Opitutaceae bacterium]